MFVTHLCINKYKAIKIIRKLRTVVNIFCYEPQFRNTQGDTPLATQRSGGFMKRV